MKRKGIFWLAAAGLLVGCKQEVKVESVSEEAEPEEVVEEEVVVEWPDASQIIDHFPWSDEEDFQEILAENETEELIAGYVTVFEDMGWEEGENVRYASEFIDGTLLQPDEIFSQYDTAGPFSEEKGYEEGTAYVNGQPVNSFGGGVCRVSSTLYNAALASGLEVVERHNHSMPVDYVPYGQDAAVAGDYKDFRFRNSTDESLFIHMELVDERLFVGFYGREAAPEIEWEHEVASDSETEFSTQYVPNEKLDEGEEVIVSEGMDGKSVHSLIKWEEDGEEMTLDLGQSHYNPLPEIIEFGE